MNICNITLDGLPLPWVDKIYHLGITLESDNSMKTDISLKRGKFIGKVNSILQEFHFAKDEVLVKLLNIYATSFYGSALWNPLSTDCDRIYRGWNVAIRNALKLHRRTHRYLVEPLSDCLHPKVMLISRLIGFYRAQLKSPKFCIRYLMKMAESDLRTSIGSTLHYVAVKCDITNDDYEKLTPALVKRKLQYAELPVNQQWRTTFAHEIKMIQNDELELDGFLPDELEEILTHICIS